MIRFCFWSSTAAVWQDFSMWQRQKRPTKDTRMEKSHSLPHFLSFLSLFLHNKVFHNLPDCRGAAVAFLPPLLPPASLPWHLFFLPLSFSPLPPSLPLKNSYIVPSIHVSPPPPPPPPRLGQMSRGEAIRGQEAALVGGKNHVAFVQKVSGGVLFPPGSSRPPETCSF